MRFRPCIDIHNGRVKQIVGSSLSDAGNQAEENFVSANDAAYYANLYKTHNLSGGHIIILNHKDSEYYEATRAQAFGALNAYPGGMQIGGGVNADNAAEYIEAGASHVIVTSFVFSKGELNMDNLKKINHAIGKERLVLDLSCKRQGDDYYVVTDRWQNFTKLKVEAKTLDYLAEYCDEFLIHAADVEGARKGIDKDIATILGAWKGIPVTYAGGIAEYSDIDLLGKAGQGRLDYTIGSALDLFGGKLEFQKICKM